MSDRPGGIPRLGVLVSGRGSNLQALIDATTRGELNASIAVVISNIAGAAALDRATAAGIDTRVLSHRGWTSRDDYDGALADALVGSGVDVVCLAGFMRRLTPRFLERAPGPVLNIHPSLLPAFPGLDAPAQAIAHGVKVSGCTVHLVTAELDDGPIVAQTAVPVASGDTAETLAARILVEEHRLYPQAVARVLAGGWRIDGRRFVDA
jgi:phosphoribosylglycinamide formyltransferase-1